MRQLVTKYQPPGVINKAGEIFVDEVTGQIKIGDGASVNGVDSYMQSSSGTISADSYASFADALEFASINDKSLLLTDGKRYQLTRNISLPNGLRMYGKGIIATGKDISGIVIDPTRTISTAVSLVSNATYPASTGIENSTMLTVASTTGLAYGDICHLTGTNTYSFNASATVGELVKIEEIVNSTTLYIVGNLTSTFTTGMTLTKLNTAVVDIDGPTFTYDGTDLLTATTKTRFASIVLLGCVSPRIHASFINDIADGVRMHTCWQPVVDATVRNLRNNETLQLFGYGVSAYSSCAYGIIKIMADDVRHAYTDGIWVTTQNIYRGRCRNMVIHDSIAANCSFASFDTHPGSINTIFNNCGVVHNRTNIDQPTKNNSYGFQDRAINTKYINCWTYGVRTPFYFGGGLVTNGQKNTTEVIGGLFEKFGTTNTTFSTIPTSTTTDAYLIRVNGAVIRGYSPSQSNQTVKVIDYFNTVFEADGTLNYTIADTSGIYSYDSCKFIGFSNIRLGQNNNVNMSGCTRQNFTTFIEPIQIGVGTTATISNLTIDAPSYGFGQLIRVGNGVATGSAIVNLGTVICTNFGPASVIGTDGVATYTKTNIVKTQPIIARGTTANRPTLVAGDAGQSYFDTTLAASGKLIIWSGTAWVDVNGTAV